MKPIPITQLNLPAINTVIRHALEVGKHELVIRSSTERRRLDQNALQAVWIKQIGQHYGESDLMAVRNWVKWYFGVPAIMTSKTKEAERTRRVLANLEYEAMDEATQKELVKLVPITSILSVSEHAKMMQSIQVYWSKNGLILE